MKKISRILLLFAVLFVFFIIAGGQKLFHSQQEVKKEYQYLSLFAEVAGLVESEYVSEVKPGKKFPGAYSAMLSALDKSSSYLDPEKTSLYLLHAKFNTFVTGIHGTKSVDYFMVTDIDKGSPADLAGIKPGSLIKSVNGKSLFGRSFWEMYLSLVTSGARDIELISIQEGSPNPVKTTLQTHAGPAPVLRTREMKKGVLLIELPVITTESAGLLKKVLQKKTANHKKALKLIIDLRKYRGGNIDGLIAISRLFFNKEIALTLKYKTSVETIHLGSSEAFSHFSTVIVNPSTIMYGELLAALFKAEKERKPVTLIGGKTRGMVAKLKHITLADGSSILITTGVFLSNGISISKTGTTPDIKLDFTKADDIMQQCIDLLNKPGNPPKKLQKRVTYSHGRNPKTS